MAVTKQRALPTWATASAGQHWEKTPIWDEEFAERWDALHRELTEPEPTTPARKPRSPRKPRNAR